MSMPVVPATISSVPRLSITLAPRTVMQPHDPLASGEKDNSDANGQVLTATVIISLLTVLLAAIVFFAIYQKRTRKNLHAEIAGLQEGNNGAVTALAARNARFKKARQSVATAVTNHTLLSLRQSAASAATSDHGTQLTCIDTCMSGTSDGGSSAYEETSASSQSGLSSAPDLVWEASQPRR